MAAHARPSLLQHHQQSPGRQSQYAGAGHELALLIYAHHGGGRLGEPHKGGWARLPLQALTGGDAVWGCHARVCVSMQMSVRSA